MLCGTRSSLRIPATASGTAGAAARAADVASRRVFGTWDFKWPQGSVIRVAFQRLQQSHPSLRGITIDDAYQRALFTKVKTRASTWLSGGYPGGNANIFFQFFDESPDDWWPAPIGPGWSLSRPGGSPGHAYDVLVSLTPLDPVQEPPTDEQLPGAIHRLPRAQLGTYARRVPLGTPTVYLGRPQYMKDGPAATSVSQYFNSDQFGHCIVHEFGHVLGLPHEHQNPRAQTNWKAAPAIATIFSAATGLTPERFVDEAPDQFTPDGEPIPKETLLEFIRTQILEPWPTTMVPGQGPKFSDWRDPPAEDDDEDYDFDSIMTDPMWRQYVTYRGVMASLAANPLLGSLFSLQRPTDSDLAHLQTMYPGARAAASQR